MKIYIDNGHDPNNGNGGKLGYKEWEGNLKSTNYLKELLLNTGKFEVLTTYDWNKYAKLRERGKKASEWGADLVLSIHSNAGGGKGAECYYSVDIPNDKIYAQAICNKISKEFGIVNRGAKVKLSKTTINEDYSGIMDSAQDGGVPHVLLVESMFHDYDPEERLLLKNDTHQKLAKIYAEVICDIFGVEKKLLESKEDMFAFKGTFKLNEGAKLINYETGQVIKTFNEPITFEFHYLTAKGNKLYAVTEYSYSKKLPNGVECKVSNIEIEKEIADLQMKVAEYDKVNRQLNSTLDSYINKIQSIKDILK